MQHTYTNIKKLIVYTILGGIGLLCISSCKKDTPPLADNIVQFETTSAGIPTDDASVDIQLTLSRAVTTETSLDITLLENGAKYGSDYTTDPATTDNKLKLIVPSGSNTTSFKITKKAGVLLDGDESLSFKLVSATSPIRIGVQDSLQLKFAAIVSEGSSLKINGGPGGAAAENTVFIDLSANKQTAVNRETWDLGLYNGNDFRVILNNTLPDAMTVALNKNDLTKVTASDTVGISLTSTFTPADFLKVDDIWGDLTKTAIAPVSANADNNKVYILNRGTIAAHTSAENRWMKIRILQKETGYTVQYANISATSFQSVDISKSDTHQFNYVSLTNGKQVDVAPQKGKWDIQWGLAAYFTPYGADKIYYPFSDLVFINQQDGVQAAEVLTSKVSYDNFGAEDIQGINFSSDRDVIGGNWRVTQGTVIGVKTDRFYVIKDPAGNIYKLKFINFIAQDGGTRGYPNIAYQLVTAATGV